MAGYILTAEKGRDGRVHNLYCLGLRGRKIWHQFYLHISTREIFLWSKETKPAWEAHERVSHEIEK